MKTFFFLKKKMTTWKNPEQWVIMMIMMVMMMARTKQRQEIDKTCMFQPQGELCDMSRHAIALVMLFATRPKFSQRLTHTLKKRL